MKTLHTLMDLQGRTALVTGAAGHIGRTACATLLELGATVVCVDRDAPGCRQAVEEMNAPQAGRAIAYPADLSEESAIRAVVDKAITTMGGLDIVVHSAAYVGTTQAPGWVAPFEEQTVATWDAAMRVNLTAAFVLAQAGRAALARSGHGSVIFLSSINGTVGADPRLYEGTAMGSPAGYHASKGGLLQLTRYLATMLAPKIRVNALSPGGVARNQPAIFQERYAAKTPLARMATEEDLKGAIAYLASDLSRYVTGHNLVVDGGFTAW